MLAYRGRADVCRYLPFEPQDRDALLDRFVSGVLARSELTGEDQSLTLGVWRRDTTELVGDVILFLRSEAHRGGEIGWVFDPVHANRGFATEAARLVLDLAFGDLGLHRVTAQLDPRNERSAALCRRLGMRPEAHFVRAEWFKGEWADLDVYAVLAEEWVSRSRRLAPPRDGDDTRR
jgi:RimJ/RimL family protein N-acetyltransferase